MHLHKDINICYKKTKIFKLVGKPLKTFIREVMWPNVHFIKSPEVVMGRWKGTESGWKYPVKLTG